jgi:T5SS/PEP-CTERM-associated repeat protein
VNRTLNIFNGAIVNADSFSHGGSTSVLGKVDFGTNGGTLNVPYLSPNIPSSIFTGTGTINTKGMVADSNLVFDAAHSATVSLSLGNVTINLTPTSGQHLGVGLSNSGSLTIAGGVNVASNNGFLGYNAGSTGAAAITGLGSKWTNNGYLMVGRYGNGTLSVTDSGSVSNTTGYLGRSAGTTGTVAVDGTGSKWANSGVLYVGHAGTGVLTVTRGGSVSNTTGYLGYSSGGSGTATIDGSGSTWTNTGTLYVGSSGTGNLSISNGGTVTASTVSVKSSSGLTTDVASKLTVGGGTGSISNGGSVRLVAGATAANGTYSPLSYGSLSGNVFQVIGGIWDDAARTVAVSGAAAANGIGGATAAFNLAVSQRALITDNATGHSVGAAFLAGTTDITFGGTVISGGTLSALQTKLASGQSILSAWDFTTTGYDVGSSNPVYLSLYAGSGHSFSDLTIWYYNGSAWYTVASTDLAYDGTYASFTVTGFSGYAVSGAAPVPVPAAVWLLGSGLAGLVGMRRRLFKKQVVNRQ